MKEVIIVDTGPLVAFYNERDEHHRWVRDQAARLPASWLTCESVLTETGFLLSRDGIHPVRTVQAVRAGFLRIDFEIVREAAALEVLMSRYADAPMSLADACLVRLAEMHKECRVLTLDRHFKHYRRYGRSVIPLLSPW